LTPAENGSFQSKLIAMKKYLLALALIYSATGLLIAQLTMKNEGFKSSSLKELLDMNHGVVNARIVGVEVYWNEEHTMCYNHYTLEVLDSSNDELPGEIVLVTKAQEGGSQLSSSGSESFQIGDELHACLSHIPRDWECGYTPRHAFTALYAYTL
jgi:hypothetical protein